MLDGKWINNLAHDLNAELLRDFFVLCQLIHSLHLDLTTEHEDQITWTLESSGKYSARSAYGIQFSGQVISNFPNLIWKAWATPPCKFFVWLLLQDRVWTAVKLQLRGWENNYFCPLCERNLETAIHLFTECLYARKIRSMIALWSNCANLHPSNWAEQSDIEEWFIALTAGGTKEAHSIAILTLWHIWKERNVRVFNMTRSTEQAVLTRIQDELAD